MNIREMRVELGDTQSEFADRYHIPFRTIQNRENGVRKPPEYIVSLLERQVNEDLVNRMTAVLPKYDPKKVNLHRRENYIGSLSWLKAVQDNESILDTQGITEAVSRYYFANGESFEGISVTPECQEAFERLAQDARSYYDS